MDEKEAARIRDETKRKIDEELAKITQEEKAAARKLADDIAKARKSGREN